MEKKVKWYHIVFYWVILLFMCYNWYKVGYNLATAKMLQAQLDDLKESQEMSRVVSLFDSPKKK